MKIDFAQTKHIVEKCWEIACTAKLPGAREMVQGDLGYDHVRTTIFQQLITQLIPNHQVFEGSTRTEMTDPREEWQNGD